MQLTGKYRFDLGDFTDPTITEIPRSSITMDDTELKINAVIYMVGQGYDIRVKLNDIIVENFDYNPQQLIERVVTRLNDFKIS